MQGIFNNVIIKGLQAVVPTTVVDNMDYASYIGERRCKKQIKLTGIRRRHKSPIGQTSADLACCAGAELLKFLNWEAKDIDVLIFLTQTPSFMIPSTAFYLQHLLGISKKCMVFDVNLGCTGVVEGIQIAASLLQNCSMNGKGLVLFADAVNEIKPENYSVDELADTMLFGSAGAAIALEKVDSNVSYMAFNNFSDGNRYNVLMREKNGNIQMDGTEVFNFAVNEVTKDLKLLKKQFSINDDDVDFYSFHQAQKLIIDTMLDDCGIPAEKDLRSMEMFGNASGASVVLNYCLNKEKLDAYDKFNTIMCVFGVGLSWTCLYATIESVSIRPIVYSDQIFKEK